MQIRNVKLVRHTWGVAAVVLFFLCVNFQSQPIPKKLKLEITVPQAQLIVSALGDYDGPQKTTALLRQYIVQEYKIQFPVAKPDSLVKHLDSSKRHP